MTDIFNFDDTSDVTDEVLEFVLEKTGSSLTVREVRAFPHRPLDRAAIMNARLIQKHEPDLIVDPVTKRVREIEAEFWREKDDIYLADRVLAGDFDRSKEHLLIKAAYLAGMREGK